MGNYAPEKGEEWGCFHKVQYGIIKIILNYEQPIKAITKSGSRLKCLIFEFCK